MLVKEWTWRAALAAAAVLATLAVGGVSQPVAAQGAPAGSAPSVKIGALVIDAPWMRATPAGAKVAAAYFKITNTGQEPDRLTGGSLPLASEVEVHEMAMAGGVMKMRKLQNGLEIKPGETVELKPGGYHLMIIGLKGQVKAGPPVKGTVRFEKAGSAEVEFSVMPIGPQSKHTH